MDCGQGRGRADEAVVAAGHVALVDLDTDIDRCHKFALYRAGELNGCGDRLFRPFKRLDGEPWYDRLARIVDMEIAVTTGSETRTLYPGRLDADGGCATADSVTVRVTIRQEGTERMIELASDLAIRCELVKMPTAAGVVLTSGTSVTRETLERLLHSTPGDGRHTNPGRNGEHRWPDGQYS